MKLLIAVAAVIAIAAGFLIYGGWRDASFERTARAYQQALPPGTTRAAVEAYLKSRGTPFEERCCVHETELFVTPQIRNESGKSYLVQIGSKEDGWPFCAPARVYVSFDFSWEDPFQALDRDTIKRITVFEQPGACM